MNNQELRAAFAVVAEANGMPSRREGSAGASQRYRITSGPHAGKTFRLRTNVGYVVMAAATGPESSAAIPSLEDVDFVGVALGRQGRHPPEFYFVPAPRMVADMRNGHQAASEVMDRGPSGSKVRILFFADKAGRDWHGYARKYAEVRLNSDALQSQAAVQPQANDRPAVAANNPAIAQAFQVIADHFHVPPSALRVSVELVPGRLIAHLEVPRG